MTRAEAKTNLVAIGIEEPTKEQIDSYLNSFQGDLQKEKDKADLLKEKADKFDQSQAELEAERIKNLTAEEKLQAATEAANLEKIGYTNAEKIEVLIVSHLSKITLFVFLCLSFSSFRSSMDINYF